MKTSKNANYAAMYLHPVRGATPSRMGSSVWAAVKICGTKLRYFLICALAILSLGATGSDGPYFPLPNLAGLALFAVIVFCVIRKSPPVINRRMGISPVIRLTRGRNCKRGNSIFSM